MAEPLMEEEEYEEDDSTYTEDAGGEDGVIDDTIEYAEDDDAPKPALVISEDDPNLARTIQDYYLEVHGEKDCDLLKDLRAQVRDEFDSAWEGSTQRRAKFGEMWKTFIGWLEAKTYPWESAANINIPVMFENLVRTTFRQMDEIFGDWQNVVGVMPIGPHDDEADILTMHDNWQFREDIPDFREQATRGLLCFNMVGHVYKHSYWDPVLRKNRHDFLTINEFYVPHALKSTMPDLSDLPFYGRVEYRTAASLEKMEDIWVNVQEVLEREPSWEDEPDADPEKAGKDHADGDEPADEEGAPYRILWHWTSFKLPGWPHARWLQVMYEYESDTILSVTIHEQPDWKEQVRYDRQTQELDDYQVGMENYVQSMVAQNQGLEQMNQAEMMGQVDPMVAQQAREQALAMPVPMPERPEWMQDESSIPEEPRWAPIRMVKQAKMIEPLIGGLGVGWGQQLDDMNMAVNTMANQYVDQATANNVPALIHAEGIEFEKEIELRPGARIMAKGAQGDDVQKGIMELRPGPANQQLFNMFTYIDGKASSGSQSQEVLSGAPGKSGETFRGHQSRLEQATKMMTVPGRSYVRLLEFTWQDNAYLNSIFLDEHQLVEIADRTLGQMLQVPVSRRMYERNYNVQFRADLRFTSTQQRINEAVELLQLPQMIPPLQMNLSFMYEAAVKNFKARGMHDMLWTLGPPPPAPMAPFGMMPPGGLGGPPMGGPPAGPGGGGSIPEGQ